MRVFHLDLIHDIYAKITVHGFIPEDVLILLRRASHLVLSSERQDLYETDIEEQPFHDARKHDQASEEFLISFRRSSPEPRIGKYVDERNQKLVLFADRCYLMISVENLSLIQPQRFDDVLVGMRMNRFLKCLSQQILAALRIGDMPVRAQHNIIGSERIGRNEESEITFDYAALIFRQSIRVFPEGYIRAHVDFLRHPMVSARVKVFLPCPSVFERHELVNIGLAVDNVLVFERYTAGSVTCRNRVKTR